MPRTATAYHSSAQSEQVIDQILTTGQITTAERNWFLNATIADVPLSAAELDRVRDVFDRLQMGLIKVVD